MSTAFNICDNHSAVKTICRANLIQTFLRFLSMYTLGWIHTLWEVEHIIFNGFDSFLAFVTQELYLMINVGYEKVNTECGESPQDGQSTLSETRSSTLTVLFRTTLLPRRDYPTWCNPNFVFAFSSYPPCKASRNIVANQVEIHTSRECAERSKFYDVNMTFHFDVRHFYPDEFARPQIRVKYEMPTIFVSRLTLNEALAKLDRSLCGEWHPNDGL